MDISHNIGILVRRLRALKGTSQEQTALESGVDRRYLCDIEGGKRNISMDVLVRLANHFGISPSRFLQLAQEAENEPFTLPMLKELLCERDAEDAIVFEQPDYISAVIGVSEDGRVIYSYPLMVEFLMLQDGMEQSDAEEFIDFNTIRALPYMGPKAPIILFDLLP